MQMTSKQISPSQQMACNTLQNRIERLKMERTRLLDEWSLRAIARMFSRFWETGTATW
jgi:hypothetical protein